MNAPIETDHFTAQQKSAAFEWLKNTDFGSDTANLNALIMGREIADLNTRRAAPELKEGEKLAFSITLPDGKTIHTILLPGDEDGLSWKAGMKLAESRDADLPDRIEQAMLFAYMPEEFQKEAYWSNTQHAGLSYYAWYQHFSYGLQGNRYESAELRVRLVRREFSDLVI